MQKTKQLALILSMSLLVACAEQHAVDPTNLNQLQGLTNTYTGGDSATSLLPDAAQLRGKALEDTAMSLGARGGLAASSRLINQRLEKDKWYLETTFNFNGMMLAHGIIPPVLEEGDNTLNIDDPNTIRISDKTYKIVAQARFATTPPHWHDYLWMSYPDPEIPNKLLLPRNAAESKIWKLAIKRGWDKGVEQSSTIFQQNLARLKRDYRGMILYRKLLEERMISPPYVAKTELGITGNGDDMRVNDQVIRIVDAPKLQTNSNGWKAVVVKNGG